MASNEIVTVLEVGEFEQNSRTSIVARLVECHGRHCIDLRAHYRDSADQLKPSPKGIMMTAEHAPALARLVNALAEGCELEGCAEAPAGDPGEPEGERQSTGGDGER